MLIKPQIPTIMYTNLDNIEPEPKIVSTRLKSKKPINPQFIAPIIVTIKHDFCNVSILFTLSYLLIILNFFFKNIHHIIKKIKYTLMKVIEVIFYEV